MAVKSEDQFCSPGSMYMKATALDMEGYGHCQANEDNYKDSMKIMQALKDRRGDDIDFMAPDNVPTGPATDVFAPVDGGQAGRGICRHDIVYPMESSTSTVHVSIAQYLCTLTGSFRHAEHREPFRRSSEAKARCAVHLGLRAGRPQLKGQGLNGKIAAAGHGPGGCGKSVVTRATAHMHRQAGKGTVLAAPTGVAAFNINGITLHSSLLLQ